MLAITTITLATWFEDQRWEACPIQDLPPEVPPSGVRVKPELPPPNVMVDVRQAAVRAGTFDNSGDGLLLVISDFQEQVPFICQIAGSGLNDFADIGKSVKVAIQGQARFKPADFRQRDVGWITADRRSWMQSLKQFSIRGPCSQHGCDVRVKVLFLRKFENGGPAVDLQ